MIAAQANVRGTRTVEQTGKSWKALQLLAVVGLVWAIIWGSMLPETKKGVAMDVRPILLGVGSFAALVLAKLGAWWNHG